METASEDELHEQFADDIETLAETVFESFNRGAKKWESLPMRERRQWISNILTILTEDPPTVPPFPHEMSAGPNDRLLRMLTWSWAEFYGFRMIEGGG